MARVAGAFGIKGWVKLQTFTEYADSLDAFKTWYLSNPALIGAWGAVEVEDFAVNVKAVVAKFKGCDDRTAAENFAKREIAVPREWLDSAAEGEYYWIDLIGATVLTQLGEKIGVVASLMETGANDVLVIKPDAPATAEILIPFIDQYLVNVDRTEKIVTVNWDKSWLED